jgi:hypothetical protein
MYKIEGVEYAKIIMAEREGFEILRAMILSLQAFPSFLPLSWSQIGHINRHYLDTRNYANIWKLS